MFKYIYKVAAGIQRVEENKKREQQQQGIQRDEGNK